MSQQVILQRREDRNYAIKPIARNQNHSLCNINFVFEHSRVELEDDSYDSGHEYWDRCDGYDGYNGFNQGNYSVSLPKATKKQSSKEEYIEITNKLGIDETSYSLLEKLINDKILDRTNDTIGSGKEAIILHGYSNQSHLNKLIPHECAIKVFKSVFKSFKSRSRYIEDDERFKNRYCRQKPLEAIYMWAEKEMDNLLIMKKIGINCPEVINLTDNILIMSFIGQNGKPAREIIELLLKPAQWVIIYKQVVEMMHKLYKNGQLVHANLSARNILWYNEECWFIDVSQAVLLTHPNALRFLLRDCNNITNFFSQKAMPGVKSAKGLFASITGIPIEDITSLKCLRKRDLRD